MGYARPFVQMFDEIQNFSVYQTPFVPWCDNDTDREIPPCSMLLFTGGEDLNPAMYGEIPNGTNYFNPIRDAWEEQWFDWAVTNKIPMFGTCRGMQFLNVKTGGKMIQHVNNHFVDEHDVLTNKGEKLIVNSIHHQMCVPNYKRADLFAAARHIAGYDTEPEALHFKDINAFGVQWHPEGLSHNDPSNDWVRNQVKTLLGV